MLKWLGQMMPTEEHGRKSIYLDLGTVKIPRGWGRARLETSREESYQVEAYIASGIWPKK
jgi:hypothetical protein